VRVIDLADNTVSPPTLPEGDPVTVMDTVTNKTIGREIIVGGAPLGVAVTPDGRHALVVNSGDETSVIVINTDTNKVSLPLLIVGPGSLGVPFTPDGSRTYITSRTDGTSGTVRVIPTQDILSAVTPT
jgi:DNA-binding beta-propeller fold protein YncE